MGLLVKLFNFVRKATSALLSFCSGLIGIVPDDAFYIIGLTPVGPYLIPFVDYDIVRRIRKIIDKKSYNTAFHPQRVMGWWIDFICIRSIFTKKVETYH